MKSTRFPASYDIPLEVCRPAVRLKSHTKAVTHRSFDLQPCLTVGLCVTSPGRATLPFSCFVYKHGPWGFGSCQAHFVFPPTMHFFFSLKMTAHAWVSHTSRDLGKILQEVEDKSPSLYSCLHCSAWYYTLWAQQDNWLKKNMSELQIVPKDPPVHLFFSPPLPTPHSTPSLLPSSTR